jgi:hypothetical protein
VNALAATPYTSHSYPCVCVALAAALKLLGSVKPLLRGITAYRCIALQYSPHTSHLTPHTSHLTPHTSHLTPHTSHLTPHTSHLKPFLLISIVFRLALLLDMAVPAHSSECVLFLLFYSSSFPVSIFISIAFLLGIRTHRPADYLDYLSRSRNMPLAAFCNSSPCKFRLLLLVPLLLYTQQF